MCTPVLLHGNRAIDYFHSVAVPPQPCGHAVSAPNHSIWYVDNTTFERFLAGVFGIVLYFAGFVCIHQVNVHIKNEGRGGENVGIPV